MRGKNIVYLSENDLERCFIQIKRNITRRKKNPAKEVRAYILVSYVINGETRLHDLERISVLYL